LFRFENWAGIVAKALAFASGSCSIVPSLSLREGFAVPLEDGKGPLKSLHQLLAEAFWSLVASILKQQQASIDAFRLKFVRAGHLDPLQWYIACYRVDYNLMVLFCNFLGDSKEEGS